MPTPEFLQWSAKNWPFAAESTGRWRGSLVLGPFSHVQVYEAVGKVHEIWRDVLESELADYVNNHPKELSESGDSVDMSLFMMGKAKERTKPMVMIVSNNKAVRIRVVQLIRDSGIMRSHPGFGLSHMDLRTESNCLQPLRRSDACIEVLKDSQVFAADGVNQPRLNHVGKEMNITTAGALSARRRLAGSLDGDRAGYPGDRAGYLENGPDIDLEDMADIIEDTDEPEFIDRMAERTSHDGMSPVSLKLSNSSKIESIQIDSNAKLTTTYDDPPALNEAQVTPGALTRIPRHCGRTDRERATINNAATCGNVHGPLGRSYSSTHHSGGWPLELPVVPSVDRLTTFGGDIVEYPELDSESTPFTTASNHKYFNDTVNMRSRHASAPHHEPDVLLLDARR